jgi:hypothetical protein
MYLLSDFVTCVVINDSLCQYSSAGQELELTWIMMADIHVLDSLAML